MGLANRLAEPGEALTDAIALAGELTRFPQLCLRADRRSAYEQWGTSLIDALENEVRGGMDVIRSGETIEGAARFARGAGRHGSFED